MDFNKSFLDCASYDGVAERAFKQLRYNCDYVNPHDLCVNYVNADAKIVF